MGHTSQPIHLIYIYIYIYVYADPVGGWASKFDDWVRFEKRSEAKRKRSEAGSEAKRRRSEAKRKRKRSKKRSDSATKRLTKPASSAWADPGLWGVPEWSLRRWKSLPTTLAKTNVLQSPPFPLNLFLVKLTLLMLKSAKLLT